LAVLTLSLHHLKGKRRGKEQSSKREQKVLVRVVGMSVLHAKDTFAWIVMCFAMRWCIIVLDALVVVVRGLIKRVEVMGMVMWL
jgi:hypothetical protein